MSYNSSTEHLGLPQWILSDPPQMSDFNGAFSAIDTGYGDTLAVKPELKTENLNDIQGTGIFPQNNTSNATTARNYPVQSSGCLVVIGYINKAYQYYICQNEGCMWHRRWVSAKWSAWEQVYPSVISGGDDTNRWIQYPDGTMIVTQKYSYNTVNMGYTEWGTGSGFYEYYAENTPPPNFPVAFAAPPACTYSVESEWSYMPVQLTSVAGSGTTATRSQWLSFVRPSTATVPDRGEIRVTVTAIGRWK